MQNFHIFSILTKKSHGTYFVCSQAFPQSNGINFLVLTVNCLSEIIANDTMQIVESSQSREFLHSHCDRRYAKGAISQSSASFK